MTDAPVEARERLLTAWRGEILAGAVYELIARRLERPRGRDRAQDGRGRGRPPPPARAADARAGLEVPDAGERPACRCGCACRRGSRPIDRLLAAREAAEDEEVDDLYKRSTGDPDTDRLLREIRKEERSHSLAVADMRSGADRGQPAAGERPATPTPPAQPGPRGTGLGPAVGGVPGSGSRARLDRILGREKWHRTGAGWISGAIYGANDGLAAVFGIVAGVSGATGGSSSVLTAGLAGAIASALSMATGAFLAERSEIEVAAANIERERQEIAEHPEEEKEELSLFYQLKGIDEQTADQLAEQMARPPGRDAAGAGGRGVRGVGRRRRRTPPRRRSRPASRPGSARSSR